MMMSMPCPVRRFFSLELASLHFFLMVRLLKYICMQALSQDQLRALRDMTEKFDISSYIGVYDGDTLQSERTWLQNNARLVLQSRYFFFGLFWDSIPFIG